MKIYKQVIGYSLGPQKKLCWFLFFALNWCLQLLQNHNWLQVLEVQVAVSYAELNNSD